MKTNYLKKSIYACLFVTALSSIASCSTNDEPMPESSNTELNTIQNNKSLPDITYHTVYSRFTDTYYVRMFNGEVYTTPSKPRRVSVTYDSFWNQMTIKTVNKTYKVLYNGYQLGPLSSDKPLYMYFQINSVTSNGTQYSIYNNLDQLVVEFLNRRHIVSTPTGNDLRFGKFSYTSSTINAYFVR